MTITDDMIDAAAKHLRETLQSGRKLTPWETTAKVTKRKWLTLARSTLEAALRQSSPPDGQAAGEPEGYREAIIGVLRPAGNIAFSMKQQAIFTSDRDNYRRISVAIDAALDLLRDTPSSRTKA